MHVRGAGGTWELSVPSTQFCSEPNTVLKNKVYLKENRGRVINVPSSASWRLPVVPVFY